ncbi:peptidoglycan DD-metalloendopeptidase family protein [Blochmannia endosymbiont of Camponotus sp.]|uniref:peptidoglycan DD-metalloendopeptidase family protein n=1 Tax=Blochmannia endosymbiont of Camponotus sp. TaxID=700220 RepID=UPI002A4E1639|nr:peptidoglycan DD-metalloendopeptidase family protein [Blochmannia endosymbiont of Camponotus sp.]
MLDNNISIIYIIIIFIFLGGCSNNNNVHSRYHSECTSDAISFNANISSPQDKEKNSWHPQKISTNKAHKYNNLNYSSYHKPTYTVQSGDTLFYIAWITGSNCSNLSKINNIKDINQLKIGQIIRVPHNAALPYFKKYSKNFFVNFNHNDNTLRKILFFIKNQLFFVRTKKNNSFNIEDVSHNVTSYIKKSELIVNKNWYWPTNGIIINAFSNAERGNKGIDISGILGQPILATASGKVVYAGDTLKGYGNLIIIKHDNNYLSAYAHNDTILVTEQQKVKMGDKIATMGYSGTNEVKLHFEIRYKGKSVDPLYYLKQ